VAVTTWHGVSPGRVRDRVVDAPEVQTVVIGAQLVPAAVPAPAPEHVRAKHAHGRRSRARSGHGRHGHRRAGRHPGAGRSARAHHARGHPRRSRPKGRGGRDIGWPQCPRGVGFRGRHGLGQPMPDRAVRFVVVGLTNGRAFTPNPCLTRHLRWVRTHHAYASAYAFATYPTRAQLRRYGTRGPYDGHRFLGALRNAGHATARYNIRLMRRHGFATPHVWLDVEPSSSRPWSGRRTWNGAVVRGWVRAYREAGYTVGVYSTRYLWHHILGGLRLRLPEWRTSGPASASAALRTCHQRSFQGGRAVLAQWWTTHRDFDRLCPAPSRSRMLEQYFHKW